MIYNDYSASVHIHRKIAFVFALLNICLFSCVVIFHGETWHDRFTIMIWIALFDIFITYILKKIFKSSQIHSKKIEEVVGNDFIYHRANLFTGVANSSLWAYLAILFIYSLFLLFVLLFLYYKLLSNPINAGILGIIHLMLMSPIVFSLYRLGTSACLFTSKTLIVNRTTLIAYENIKKYQFIKLAKGGYFLDINSIEGFARLRIDETQYADIKTLISNHT